MKTVLTEIIERMQKVIDTNQACYLDNKEVHDYRLVIQAEDENRYANYWKEEIKQLLPKEKEIINQAHYDGTVDNVVMQNPDSKNYFDRTFKP